jgi:serine/threonine protein kinase
MPANDLRRQLPTLSHYDILERIAESHLASLYKGVHRPSGAIVAIKIPSAAVADDPLLRKRFEEEFRAGSTLRHPHLVRTVDFGQEGPTLYLVMEFVEGETLGDRLEREGRLAEAEAVRIITEVAQGLHEAHKHGLVHRAVKPDNILLSTSGQAKLSDLGLVKDLESRGDLTRPRTGLGTPNFIAPEQFSDAKHADFRCDLYSLGATLYMAATGELPFRGPTIAAVLRKKLANELTPPRQLVPALGIRTERAILRALRVDPHQRHASCREFVDELTGQTTGPEAEFTEAVPARRAPGKPLREERRAWVRYSYRSATSCNVDDSIHPGGAAAAGCWEGVVQDLSVAGIRVLLERRFEPGAVLSVEVRSPDGRFTRSLEMRVTRVKPAGRGRWFIGGVYTEPLGADDLRKLL